MADSLALLVVRNQVETYGGPATGTEYDRSGACPACGTGATQTGPLRLRIRKLPKHDIWLTLDHEIVVSAGLADILFASGCSCMTQVISNSGAALQLWQLRSEWTLPPFSSASTGVVRERPCTTCNGDGYFGIPHVPMRLVYSNLGSPSPSHMLYATFECFGNSRLREPFSESVLAAPNYVATGALLACLERTRPRGLEFEEVAVVADE